MKKTKVAINGFGRIGRAFFKVAMNSPEISIVAINDLGDIHNLAYLLKYDTSYGVSDFDVSVKSDNTAFIVNGAEIAYISQKDAILLPWKEHDVDVVVESTGLFTSYDKANVHILAGAKRVVISAPAKDDPTGAIKGETILMGMNEDKIGSVAITSNASCTTNAANPVLAILDETVGVEKAMLNTVHAYTASQSIVDGPNKKDWREGRAAAMNLVPSSTGAAVAVTKILKHLEGLFDGISIRVPVVTGSIVDVTFISKKNTTTEEINDILTKASQTDRWASILSVTTEPIVSRDIIGNPHVSIADLSFTRVVGGNLVKVLVWYDNEMGYTHSLVRHVVEVGKLV